MPAAAVADPAVPTKLQRCQAAVAERGDVARVDPQRRRVVLHSLLELPGPESCRRGAVNSVGGVRTVICVLDRMLQ